MKKTPLRNAALLAILTLSAPLARAHDLPTIDRVEYVLECMRASSGPRQEMLYKCSCSLDSVAGEFASNQDFVEARTTFLAMSIGGERGSVMRDSEEAKALAGKFRAAVARAKKACFMN